MDSKALFITREHAIKHADKVGRAKVVGERSILHLCRAYPKVVRGEMLGYEAWYPFNGKNMPVMEADIRG